MIKHAWIGCLGLAWVACSTGTSADDDTDAASETDTVDTESDTQVNGTDETDVVETDETDPGDPCLASPTVLRVGSGETELVPVAPGATVEMVNGPQGGWHVNVSVEVDNTPQLVVLEVTVTDNDSGTVVTDGDPQRFPVALVPPVFGTWACDGAYPGLQAVLDFTKLGAVAHDPDRWQVLCGHDITVDVAVRTTLDELLAEGSFTAVLQPDPDNGPYCLDL